MEVFNVNVEWILFLERSAEGRTTQNPKISEWKHAFNVLKYTGINMGLFIGPSSTYYFLYTKDNIFSFSLRHHVPLVLSSPKDDKVEDSRYV